MVKSYISMDLNILKETSINGTLAWPVFESNIPLIFKKY